MYVPSTYQYILQEKNIYLVYTRGEKYVPGIYSEMLVYSGTILKHGTHRYVLGMYLVQKGTHNSTGFQMYLGIT